MKSLRRSEFLRNGSLGTTGDGDFSMERKRRKAVARLRIWDQHAQFFKGRAGSVEHRHCAPVLASRLECTARDPEDARPQDARERVDGIHGLSQERLGTA